MNSPARTKPSLAEEAPHELTKHNMRIELSSDMFSKILLVPQEHAVPYIAWVVMVPEKIDHSLGSQMRRHKGNVLHVQIPTHAYRWVQTCQIAEQSDILRNSLEQRNRCRFVANQLGKHLNGNL